MKFYKLFELVRNTIINIILQLNLIKINMILKTKWLLSLLLMHLDIYIYIYILVKKMIKFSYREEKKFEMHQNNKFETQKIKRI